MRGNTKNTPSLLKEVNVAARCPSPPLIKSQYSMEIIRAKMRHKILTSYTFPWTMPKALDLNQIVWIDFWSLFLHSAYCAMYCMMYRMICRYITLIFYCGLNLRITFRSPISILMHRYIFLKFKTTSKNMVNDKMWATTKNLTMKYGCHHRA